MSISELNETRNLHNESAHSSPITQKKTYHAIDMESIEKETVTPGTLAIAKSRDIVSIDVKENSIEHSTDTNEVVDTGILANISELKMHIITPMVGRRKRTINELYDSMVDFGKQGLARLTWHQQQHPTPPEQTVMTHDDCTHSQASLQTQVPPPGPKYFQSQQWSVQGIVNPPGQVYPPDQGWSQPQPPPYPQNPGYGQGARYPQQFQAFLGNPLGSPQQPQGDMPEYDPKDRNPFVALVLAVTCIMLATTAIFIGTVVLTPDLKITFRKLGPVVILPCMVVLFGINYAFMCAGFARTPPCNFILLALTTITMSIVTAALSAHYDTEIILQAVLATAIIVGLCTALACTNFDFTSYMLYIVMFSLVLFVCSTIFFVVRMATGKKMTMIHLVILIIGTLLQVMVLVVELQMILGGKSIELEEDEWALGAFFLYTSIINLFIKMIQILGILENK